MVRSEGCCWHRTKSTDMELISRVDKFGSHIYTPGLQSTEFLSPGFPELLEPPSKKNL